MASREAAIKNNLNDRARKVGQFDELTTQDIDALIAFYDFTCLYPGCNVKPATSVDHVKPLSKGGTNTYDNLQLLCVNHNKQKGDEEIDYRNGKVFEGPEKQGKYRKHDWNALQFEYVSTDISLRDLAQKYDMDSSLVLKRAASERWLKERKNFAINLQSEVQQEAIKQDVSARVMILEAARIALEEWKNNDKASDLAQLAKILELAARVEGLELDKRSITVKDWRDVAGQNNTDPDELEQYFAALEGTVTSGVEDGQGAGWTD